MEGTGVPRALMGARASPRERSRVFVRILPLPVEASHSRRTSPLLLPTARPGPTWTLPCGQDPIRYSRKKRMTVVWNGPKKQSQKLSAAWLQIFVEISVKPHLRHQFKVLLHLSYKKKYLDCKIQKYYQRENLLWCHAPLTSRYLVNFVISAKVSCL